MKNSNKLGLVFSLLAIVSVFLPWAKASSSYSAGGLGSGSYSTGAISGITLGVGIAGIICALAAAYLSFNRMKQTWIVGAIMLIDSIYYVITMGNAGGKSSASYGEYSASASVSVDPQIGLFVFALSSLLILVTTLKDRKG
jgi:hypothetical protein